MFKRGGRRILIISLKCGGVGLNLVNANRCINLDLAWNNATESQVRSLTCLQDLLAHKQHLPKAIDRLHRFGQDKEVIVKRVVVANTIEGRIMKLQIAKQGLADAALGEGQAPKHGRMTPRDIQLVSVNALRSCH
jgi:SNF2 family DNA or RNA helicase